MSILVGTSGWQYRDWREVLYPAGLPQRRWLERYAEIFATVESNAAFYRLPKLETFESWRDRTPPGFVMAVKASRYLTHVKRLQNPEEPVERLMKAAAGLGPKLGPILLQLPPTLTVDVDLLDRCLACFPRDVRLAVEPRHASWWTDELRAVLTERGAALCWADRKGQDLNPLWRTADWYYVRLHEGPDKTWPAYDNRRLKLWADRLAGCDGYIYFNNDMQAAAVANARRFTELLTKIEIR